MDRSQRMHIQSNRSGIDRSQRMHIQSNRSRIDRSERKHKQSNRSGIERSHRIHIQKTAISLSLHTPDLSRSPTETLVAVLQFCAEIQPEECTAVSVLYRSIVRRTHRFCSSVPKYSQKNAPLSQFCAEIRPEERTAFVVLCRNITRRTHGCFSLCVTCKYRVSLIGVYLCHLQIQVSLIGVYLCQLQIEVFLVGVYLCRSSFVADKFSCCSQIK
jgi:hypothetical protein